MAGGDITNVLDVKTVGVGGRLSVKTVVADVEFGSGATGITTVTAAEIGLSKIIGFSASVFGASTGVGELVYSTTAYASGGVSSILLECINDASALVDRTVSVMFWGS
jgi:hypothetical protein